MGPQHPICACESWNRGRIEALQLGYGDENNSIPLISADAGMLARFESLMDRAAVDAPPRATRPLAIQVTVRGRPRWGPSLPEAEVPPALRGIRKGLVLEYVDMGLFGGELEHVRRLYYSAYLWVIFVIRRPNGDPVFPATSLRPDGGEIWRGLVPFFEHGNVADGLTYDFMKAQLARKALAGLVRLVERTAGWQFTYACAFDDPGCVPGKEMRRFPEPPPSQSVRHLLQDLLSSEFAELEKTGRVSVEASTERVYSTCHLTDMIELYYRQLGPGRSR